jgi:hypothetical protein
MTDIGKSQGCDVCGETDGLFTYMDNNKKAHMVCSDACMDKNKGKGRGTTPVLGGGRMVINDIPMDEDPYYTTKDRKCKSCGEMNTGSDTCSGPCGQCWSCNCDCDMIRKTSFEIELKGRTNWLNNTFNCPSCGTETKNGDCPAFAPDYVCMECHVEWMEDHDDWREDTMQRIKHHMEKEPTVD